MALHPKFPESPFAALDPSMLPLLAQLLKKAKDWRDSSCVSGA